MLNHWKLLWLLILPPVIFGQVKIPTHGNGLSPDEFGAISSKLTSFAMCKGPKREDCAETKMNFSDQNFDNISFTITFLQNVAFERLRIAVWMGNNTGSADIVKGIGSPCRHFFLGPILLKYFKASASTCVSKKGVYKFSMDMRAMFKELFGMQFFYGIYKAQSVMLSKTCNIVCVLSTFTLEKKKT